MIVVDVDTSRDTNENMTKMDGEKDIKEVCLVPGRVLVGVATSQWNQQQMMRLLTVSTLSICCTWNMHRSFRLMRLLCDAKHSIW